MACEGEAGPGARREGAVVAAATSSEILGGDEEKREEKHTGQELLWRDCSSDQSARSCHSEEHSWRGRGRATVRGEVDDFGLARGGKAEEGAEQKGRESWRLHGRLQPMARGSGSSGARRHGIREQRG
ncbi:hypothetical protein CFC21_083451 [Triticum aestivum]|uniref:Uncharacterized protein n=3 Tax=Triticum TaxID=4564 RepID=A0A9R0Y0M3_TRITD|nr:hypothetical protein CFC21_083451 [Triticum aestivum]VAI46264.1 unnamed protein product [Triticum turgidum subsp. durum]